MADSWRVVEFAQESLHSSELSGMPGWGGSSRLCPALPKERKAKLDLRPGRSGGRGRRNGAAGTKVAGTHRGSGDSIREGPEGAAQQPVASSFHTALCLLIDARFERISKPIRKNLAALKSQNQLEHLFLLDTEQSMPEGVTPVWIGDRGYARSLLFEQSEKEGRPYIIRGRKGTVITYRERRMKLHQLKGKPYRAVRYDNVLYHARRQVPVDVTVYQEPHFDET